jgi:type VI protein secretion system component VasK
MSAIVAAAGREALHGMRGQTEEGRDAMGRLIGIVIVVLLIVAGIWWYQSGGQQKVEEVAQQASEAAGQAAQQVTETAGKIAEQAGETAGQLADQAGQAAQQATETAGQAAQQAGEAASGAAQQVSDAAQALVVGGIDLGKQLSEAFDGLKSSLAGITDAASAQAQLPNLQQLQAKLDGMTATVDSLPAAGKSALATLVSGSLPTLRSAAEQVAAIEGVGPVVKPTLDAILAKLDAWSKAPA